MRITLATKTISTFSTWARLCLSVLALAMSLHAQAKDTALLIGVGRYLDSSHDLPGIDLDIESMTHIAKHLGYETIITLQNHEATEAKIWQTLSQLNQSINNHDRFLFYFSGHGTRIPDFNGDEEDQADEVLVASDVRLSSYQGTETLDGVIVDDDLSKMLKSFRSKHTLALVDACNSGTVTKRSFLNLVDVTSLRKNGAREGKRKMISWPGMPTSREHFRIFDDEESLGDFVSISAAGDEEYAIATDEGSIFTLALQEAVNQRINASGFFTHNDFTPDNLTRFTTQFIHDRVSPDEIYTPRLTGNKRFYFREIPIDIPQADGPNWQTLDRLVTGNALKLSSRKSRYKVGELLEADISLPQASSGYLNIVQVDSRDNVDVLFPNKYHQDSLIQVNQSKQVNQGKLSINKDLSGFNIRANGDPLGDVMLLAFFTAREVNLYTTSHNERDSNGKLLDIVVRASQKGLNQLSRSFVVEADINAPNEFVYAGKIRLSIED